MKPRPESRFDYGNLKPIEVDPKAHTPSLPGVSKQDYSERERKHANELLQSRVQYHHDTYQPPQSVKPSPAPQSRFDNMYSEARKHTSYWRPDTRGPSSLEIQRTKALLTLGLPLNPNPTRTDVKQAFNKAALKYHPDKVADRTEKFMEVHKAYEFLISNLGNQNGGNVAQTGGNNTIKRRHKKHKHAKKTRGKTRGKTYRKTRKNTIKRRR
jgi:hypothetical protein